MSDIQNYLKMVAEISPPKPDWAHSSYESLVLKAGTLYTEGRLEIYGKAKECFANAYTAAVENPGWTYVEGYANSIIPVAHAWCVDENGIVVETTWPEVGTEYYGVPLDLTWVMNVILETRHYGVLGSDWMRECVLLREGLPVEAMKVRSMT